MAGLGETHPPRSPVQMTINQSEIEQRIDARLEPLVQFRHHPQRDGGRIQISVLLAQALFHGAPRQYPLQGEG